MKDLVIDYLNHKDLKKLKYFIKNNWSKKHLFTYDEKIFNFQYLIKKKYTFLVAKIKNKIVGVQGFIDNKKYNQEKNYKQIFLAFWCVKKNTSFGIGLKLHQLINKINKPSFVGIIGINNRALKLHKWLGFKVIKMEHQVLVSPYIKNFKILELGKYKIKNKISPSNQNFIKINKNNIHNFVKNNFYKIQTPQKSNKYILKRYLNHPIYKYDVFLLNFNKNPSAIFVTRKINIKESSVLKLVDYIGENKFFYLFNEFGLDLLKKNNSEYIDFYFHGISKKFLKKSLFVECNKYEGLIVPNHFEPLEKKNIEIFCAYKINKNFKNIKLFRADGDGDRPSKI